MNLNRILLQIFVLISFGLSVSANSFAEQEIKNFEKMKKAISERIDGMGKFTIKPSPIKGLYLVIAPPRVLYISEDANYIIEGNIVDVNTGEDHTDLYRNGARFAAVESVKDSMIIFSPPKDKVKHTISVFTDMDCYYCQKLHKEIKEYNRLGIAVRYLAFPRQGLKSPTYNKSVSVWCAKDKKAALTKAKNGEALPEKTCDHPVDKHFALGGLLGVKGTPALLLGNGQLYPGYVPAAQLKAGLDRASAEATK